MQASSAALAGLETPFQTDLSASESGVAHGVTPAELGGIEHLKNDRVPHALHHRYSFMCSRPVSIGWDVTYTDNQYDPWQKEERENRLSFSDHCLIFAVSGVVLCLARHFGKSAKVMADFALPLSALPMVLIGWLGFLG